MNKLKELMALCKCEVSVVVNSHRSYYETADEYLRESDTEDVSPEVYKKMVETDTVIRVQAYPNTPVGFCFVYHHDLDAALDEILDQLK